MKPAAFEGTSRALVIVVVAGEQLRRAMHDLADDAGRHVLHRIIDDARLDIEHRLPRRAGLAQLVFGWSAVASGAISVWP